MGANNEEERGKTSGAFWERRHAVDAYVERRKLAARTAQRR
jgi:hypothetical protein